MKAVILAAGQGTRIRSVHGEHPKCLIEVDNTTILDHQLEALSVAGIDDVAIVVGYEKEQIIEHVKTRKARVTPRIRFFENPAFAITSNMAALGCWDSTSMTAISSSNAFTPGKHQKARTRKT